jgi:DNA-binding SARP family transcriptional activator
MAHPQAPPEDGPGPVGRPVEIRLLGPFEVSGVGGARLGGARQQSVLALLAMHLGRVLSRDQVIEAVWADPPRSAVSTLHGYISHLRRALEAAAVCIESCGAGYRLVGPGEAVDARRFDDLFAEGAAQIRQGGQSGRAVAVAALEEALGLWRGPALQGLLDAPFAAQEARRLEQRRVDASMLLAEALVELDRPSDAAERLEPVLAENLFNEECCLLLMRALSAAGRRAEALAAFQRVRGALAEELGIEPSPSLRSAEMDLLLGPHEVSPAPSALRSDKRGSRRSPWPAHSTSFVGRAGEIRELSRLLQTRRLVTVVGPGGAGKTRLALATVESLGNQPAPDLQAFVDLAGRSDPGGLWAATAAAVCDVNIAPTIDAIIRALTGRRALIVLDNCEHMLEACAEMVRELLVRTDMTTVVVTSREALGIDGETVWTIPPLGAPGPGDSVAAALESDSVRLFLDRCATRSRGDDEVRLISEIVRHAEGVPLAGIADQPAVRVATGLLDHPAHHHRSRTARTDLRRLHIRLHLQPAARNPGRLQHGQLRCLQQP